jgi:DNA-directed RNA polymerase subunit RPC12/RpoP
MAATQDVKIKAVKTPQKYSCPKCGAPHHYRLHRNWFIKYVLFFLPIGHYFCAKCSKGFYIIKKDNLVDAD